MFFFGTSTGFATHVASVCSSLMNFASLSRLISDSIALRFGSEKRRKGCRIGLARGSRLRGCSASSLGTPGMSAGHHAKISQRSRRNSTSVLSYARSRLAAMDVVFLGSVGWTCTSLESLEVSKACSCKDLPPSGKTSWLVVSFVASYSACIPNDLESLWKSLSHLSDTAKVPLTVIGPLGLGILHNRYV